MDLIATSPTTMNHHMSKHANPYSTPQSTTAPVSYPSPFRSLPQTSPPPSHQSMHSSRPGNSSLPGQFSFQTNNATRSGPAAAQSSRPSSRDHLIPERHLPAREFGDDKELEDAYVAFILYCNPTILSDVDTADLRRNFSNPPRSDGKTFSTKILYELLQKFETKEIKTWTDLALELGVQKPAVEKGQSSQKVQQYSVRLKVCFVSHVSIFESVYCTSIFSTAQFDCEFPSISSKGSVLIYICWLGLM